jgi:hypothetical protein
VPTSALAGGLGLLIVGLFGGSLPRISLTTALVAPPIRAFSITVGALLIAFS